MKKLLNPTINNRTLRIFIFNIPLLIFFILFLDRGLNFVMPYGYDEIITVWPVARNLAEAELNTFFNILLSSFTGEDHLFPVTNFLSYLFYSEKFNPIIAISIVNKVLYLFLLISIYVLINSFFQDKVKTLFAFGLVLANQTLFFYHIGFNLNFNLVLFFSIWTIYFLNKYLQLLKIRYLFLIFLTAFLGSFTFENYFLTYALAITYAGFKIREYSILFQNKILILSKLAITLFASLLPYLYLHFKFYGKILPGSRLDKVGDDQIMQNMTYVTAKLTNDWLFGIPLFLKEISNTLFIVIIILLIFIFIKKLVFFKKIILHKNYLIIPLIISLLIVNYTGRYHPGLWTIAGIFSIIIFSDVIVSIINFKIYSIFKRDLFLSVFVLIIISSSFTINSHKKMVNDYRLNSHETLAAYKLIGSESDKIALLRLPGANDLPHPIAFWIGNKLFNGDYGLSYFHKYKLLIMKNMYVEFYPNLEDNPPDFFIEKVLKKSNDLVYIFKNKNIYFTLYKNNKENKIFSGASWNSSYSDYYDINFFPGMRFDNPNAELKVNLSLYNPIDNETIIIYNDKIVDNFNIDGFNVTFFVPAYFNKSKLIIRNRFTDKTTPVKKIDINLTDNFYFESNFNSTSSVALPFIKTESEPCRVDIKSRYVNVYATMLSNAHLYIDTLYPFSYFINDSNVSFSSFNIHSKNKSINNKFNFDHDSNFIYSCIF